MPKFRITIVSTYEVEAEDAESAVIDGAAPDFQEEDVREITPDDADLLPYVVLGEDTYAPLGDARIVLLTEEEGEEAMESPKQVFENLPDARVLPIYCN
jgi:hypothetical protein